MSTNDVPGAKKANNDALSLGCWAEHDDGSLIFVEGNEAGRVVFSMFDLSKDPPIEYREGMDELGFKKKFSFNPKDKKSIKWTWHDKTPMPWERVMKDFPDGPRHASAGGLMTAAAAVAKSMGLTGHAVVSDDHAHKTDQVVPKGTKKIIKKLQKLLDQLNP